MNWIQALYSEVTPWLLEPDLPSVRYLTLTKLLDHPSDSPEAVEAKEQIMREGPALEIMNHYDKEGRWQGEQSYYTYKYTATHWQLLLLAELQADGDDPRIATACQRMIAQVHRESRSIIWPCFHGNLVGYLHDLGHAQDERVHQFEQTLAEASLSSKWLCDWNGGLPCAWGVARALWGLGQIPSGQQSATVREAVESGVRFLGRFRLRDGNYPTSTKRHSLWERLNFPLFYQADVLFTLRALTDLGRLADRPTFRLAAMWLESQCRNDSRWNGASPYRRRTWTLLEPGGRPSKWVTWQALYVLKSLEEAK